MKEINRIAHLKNSIRIIRKDGRQITGGEKGKINPPTIEHIAKDEDSNLTFRIMAYRQLTDDEVLAAVKGFLNNPRAPKLRNQTITIQAFFGTDPD